MMGRITRETMFMMMARAAAMRATCHRLNVGAIVTHHNSPVSVGWNGAKAGADHCAGNDCPGIIPGNCGTLHAETNALEKAALIMAPYSKNAEVDLYVTHSPCAGCMDVIMSGNLHVKRLLFEIPYRSTQHLGRLEGSYPNRHGHGDHEYRRTEVLEVTPAGYVVDYFTRKVIDLV